MDNILEKVHRAGLKFLEPLNTGETYKVIVEEAQKLVKAESGTMLLMQDGVLKRVYTTSPIFLNITPRKKGYNYKVYKTGIPAVVKTVELSKAHPEFKRTSWRSTLIVPISNHGRRSGVLSVHSKKMVHFKESDLRALKLFSSFASLAIRKAQLYHEIYHALEVRDTFIAMASHELRTPLTSVNGYIQLIRSKINGESPQLGRWIESLAAESLRLTLLVKELLEVNRIKTGKLHFYFKECSLIEITNRAIANFTFTNEKRELKVSIKVREEKDKIIADYGKILQVINNLLENAAKFSPISSQIKLTLTSKKNNLLIIVEDQGIGIRRQEITKVLKKFAKGSNTQKEGMGLGLYLVNNIVNHHQGSLNIKSDLKRGTKIEVSLPKAKI